MQQMRRTRLFVASPSDVADERDRVDQVVARLSASGKAGPAIDVYRWERSFYRANHTYQNQISDPANCDIVIVIFGHRLGSELPEEFRRRLPSGDAYPSGTAFELLSAMAAADLRGWPDVYVFRKAGAPDGADPREQARLDAFFERWFRNRTLPIHDFADADAFERTIEALLGRWVAERPNPTPVWRGDDGRSPFRGLQAFDARHAAIYFGRDRKVARALEALLRAPTAENGRPFLLVVGASGSGKSSLVRAGLVRRLLAPGIAPGVDGWRVAVMRPGARPLAALAKALFVAPESDDEAGDPGGFGRALPELAEALCATPADLAAALRDAPAAGAAAVVAALDRIRPAGRQGQHRVDLLLVVDQLEEMFDNAADEAERAAFARALTAFCDTRRVWVAATLRVDLYGRVIEAGSTWLPLKDSGGHYDLASPGEAEIKEILEKSAEAAGLAYERDPASGETLDERLLADAKGSNDTLPLLEYSLDELFRRKRVTEGEGGRRVELTFAAYREIGGIDGVIEETAKRALADERLGLTEAEIASALPRLLRRLAVRVSDEGAATAGRIRLTTRSVPLADLTHDPVSRKLVEALLAARLFVSQDGSEETAPTRSEKPAREPMLRLAHERVLTSWSRARRIVEEFRSYFEARADLEQRYALWVAGGRRRELLLPAGKPLADAEALARNYRDELGSARRPAGDRPAPTLVEFVETSGRRARFWQRLGYLAAGVFFVVALVASTAALVALNAEGAAERNYGAAKGGADRLITLLAEDLRQQKGVPTETIDHAFATVDELLADLGRTVASGGSVPLVDREIGWIAVRVFGAADAGRALLALKMSQAKLLYDFAFTYHQAGADLQRAMDKARASLDLQDRLRQQGVTGPDLDELTARTDIEIGDLDRKRVEIEDERTRQLALHARPDFALARQSYRAAERLLDPLLRTATAPAAWIKDGSWVETRLGDLDDKDGDRDAARRHYDVARTYALRLVQALPGDAGALNEFAWSFRKLGQIRSDPSLAGQDFADEVCVRHHIAALFKTKKDPPRDLSFALAKLARARAQGAAPDFDGASDAAYESLLIITTLIDTDKDPLNFKQTRDALKLVAEIRRKAGDAERADAFGKAALAVEQQMDEAFAKLPATGAEQVLAHQQDMIGRGVFPMMGDQRPLVENVLQNFTSTRLDAVRAAARDCWSTLGVPDLPGPDKSALRR